MAHGTVHLAIFDEHQINEASEAISRLHDLGIGDEDISVISGVPLSDRVLGRPMTWTRVPIFAGVGALFGLIIALLLVFGTQYYYPIRVGNLPNSPIPAAVVVVFELTMLGMLLSTFLGVFLETISPSYGPAGYDARVTDGSIGILFTSPTDKDRDVHSRLEDLGAELVHRAEVKKLWP